MSNVTLWARPAWEIDRWVKEGVLDGFTPAAEIVKDGEDAVVAPRVAGGGRRQRRQRASSTGAVW